MAMLADESHPTEFVQQQFDLAAGCGGKIFLKLRTALVDPGTITHRYSYESVRDGDDIPFLLKELDRQAEMEGNSVALIDVMDLTRSFNDQHDPSVRMQALLSEQTLTALETRKAQKILAGKQRAWCDLPFYKRWFTPYPRADQTPG